MSSTQWLNWHCSFWVHGDPLGAGKAQVPVLQNMPLAQVAVLQQNPSGEQLPELHCAAVSQGLPLAPGGEQRPSVGWMLHCSSPEHAEVSQHT